MIKIDFHDIEEKLKSSSLTEVLAENKQADYPLVITGIPQNWHEQFKTQGFDEYAVFQDYWIDSLTSPGKEYSDYEFLHSDDCHIASEISISCRGCSRGFEGEPPEWFSEWLQGEDWLKDTAVLLHKSNNRIAGISCAATYAHDSEKGTVVWVRMMAVHPDFHGQGIGTKLLMQTLQYGFEHGAKRAFLHVDTENTHAIKMYLKAGFQPRADEMQVDMIKKV